MTEVCASKSNIKRLSGSIISNSYDPAIDDVRSNVYTSFFLRGTKLF